MKLESIDQLYLHELLDLLSVERQLTKALERLGQAASDEGLKSAFVAHLAETQSHEKTVAGLVKSLGRSAQRVPKCKGFEGIISEALELVQADADAEVKDAALIAAAQRAEHYEMAGYGSAIAFARTLGRAEDVRQLEEILQSEKSADAKLTEVALRSVNEAAAAETGGMGAEGDEEHSARQEPGTTHESSMKGTERETMARDHDREGHRDGRGGGNTRHADDDRRGRSSGEYRERDEHGRFTSEDHESGGRRSSSEWGSGGGSGGGSGWGSGSGRSGEREHSYGSYGSYSQDRDQQGRFTSDDDRGGRGYGNGSGRSGSRSESDSYDRNDRRDQGRDEYGRFASDDERGGSNRGDWRGSNRPQDERDWRGSMYSSEGRSSERDRQDRFVSEDGYSGGSRYGTSAGRGNSYDEDRSQREWSDRNRYGDQGRGSSADRSSSYDSQGDEWRTTSRGVTIRYDEDADQPSRGRSNGYGQQRDEYGRFRPDDGRRGDSSTDSDWRPRSPEYRPDEEMSQGYGRGSSRGRDEQTRYASSSRGDGRGSSYDDDADRRSSRSGNGSRSQRYEESR